MTHISSLLFLLVGCWGAELVEISGRVFSGQEQSSLLTDASVEILDFGEQPIDVVQTDGDGHFYGEARAASVFLMGIEAPGYVPTGFVGSVGYDDYEIEDGVLWARTEGEQDALEVLFDGCPGVGTGGTIEGEIRLYVPGNRPEELPVATTGYVTAWTEGGEELVTCYLADDPDQLALDPGATHTGHHGRFAIFGVQAGVVLIEVGYDVGDATYWASQLYIYVPKNGTAPLYPAWVGL